MVSWLAIVIWSALTLTFIYRLRVILLNMTVLVARPGRGFGVLPQFNPRPLRQLIVWLAELWLLILFYSAFGQSVIAHVSAAVCATGVVWILRERGEPHPLRAVQLIPLREVAPAPRPH